MTKLHYNIKLDIPLDADSARYFIPEGYTARIEDGVLIIEPKESEGERIRKFLVRLCKRCSENSTDFMGDIKKSDVLAWLEKQKERKQVSFSCGHGNDVEWSEEDERMRQTAIEACKTVAADYENSNARFYKCKEWLESLRPQPQQNMSIYFMMYLDEHRPDGKMCLSNAECNQIEVAFKNQDWDIILKYAEKYLPRWKPSGEQMAALFSELPVVKGCGDKAQNILESLYEDLKKLM